MCGAKRIGIIAVGTALLVAFLFSGTASAQSLEAQATASGVLVAHLHETEFTAILEGTIEWSGEAALGHQTTSFTTTGTFRGIGRRGLLTFVSEAWIGYSSQGETASGKPMELTGLLYLMRKTLLPLQAGETVTGWQIVVLRIGDETTWYEGVYSGSAAGTLVPPDMPGTLQLEGSGELWIRSAEVTPITQLAGSVPLGDGFLEPDFLGFLESLLLDDVRGHKP